MNEQGRIIASKVRDHMRILHKEAIDSTGVPVVVLDSMVLMAALIGGRAPDSAESLDVGVVRDQLMLRIRCNRNEVNAMCESSGGRSLNDSEWKQVCTAVVQQAWVYCVTVEAVWSLPREYCDLDLYKALARSAVDLLPESLRPSGPWCDLVAEMHFNLFPELVGHYFEMQQRVIVEGIDLPDTVGWCGPDSDEWP